LPALVLFALAIVWLPCLLRAQQTQIPPRSFGAESTGFVNIKSLVAISSPLGSLRSVAYSYKFPGRESIEIKGLGIVSATGSHQYLTDTSRIEFRDPNTKEVVLTVPLEKPLRVMGRDELSMPLESQFPKFSRVARWNQPGPFAERLATVLNRYFPSGFLVSESNRVNTVLTSYRSLEGVPEPEHGRVAVIVEQDPDQAPAGLQFRIRFTAQERRSHTDWRGISSETVKRSAEEFVGRLLEELQKGGN
jgi:hypothetical protein